MEHPMSLDPERMRLITANEPTISGKIRALDRAGVPRADIARFLNRRYQHVRNVLEADKQRLGSAPQKEHDKLTNLSQPETQSSANPLVHQHGTNPNSSVDAIFRLRTNADGSLLLPRHVLGSLNIGGDEIIIGALEGDQLRLASATVAMRQAQELVRSLIPGDDSLADALLADRRREVEQEQTTNG
jgi:hypothetical protein